MPLCREIYQVDRTDYSISPNPPRVAVGEAMLAGLPTVASNVGGIDTWIEHQHDGILVPPGDPQALASALGTLIDDGELRDRLGQTAPRHRRPALHDAQTP